MRVLILEDRPEDAELMVRELRRHGQEVTWERVVGSKEFASRIDEPWDVILADHSLPEFDGARALAMLRATNLDVPFILVTGSLNEAGAVECIRMGADDFLLKDRLGRLGAAVARAIDDRRLRAENRAAEAALRQNEQRLRDIIEASPNGILVTDDKGLIRFVNSHIEGIFGYPREELIGQPVEMLVPETRRAPHVAHRDGFTHAPSARRLGAGRDLMGRRKDGGVFPAEIGLSPFESAEGPMVIASVVDVTERVAAERALRESEERYRSLVDLSPDGIVVHVEGRVVFVNRALLAMLGYEREEDVLGRSVFEAVLPENREFAWQRLQARLAGAPAAPRIEEKLLRADGSALETEMMAAPLTFEGRHAVQVVVRDISERKQLQAQLLQAQKMEAMGKLAGGIAHDFNNLLQAVLSAAQSLQLDPADGAAVGAVRREIEEHVKRGAALTRQLLIFARREHVRREPRDLNTTLREIAAWLPRLLRENVALALELAEEPLPIEADRGQLEQVLMNLAVNAVDAMPRGGRLTIRSGALDDEFVWFSVDDSGEGVPEELLPRIFEPFFTTKEPGRGSGLGLSVVHGIVADHGGRVEATSRPDEGTTIRVILPREASVAPAPATPPAAGRTSRGGGERILLVEDNSAVRGLFQQILEHLGYEVRAAGSAEEAAALPGEAGVDLLLTDLSLPGASGIELARTLRERWPALMVVVLSGYAGEDIRQSVATTERIRYVQKPVNMETLAREVRAALDA
jgi:PAS domain S-box-containing protein